MQTTQHNPARCPVYLHPAAATSTAAIAQIQRTTGLLVIVNLSRPTIAPTLAVASSGDQGPSGGDAA